MPKLISFSLIALAFSSIAACGGDSSNDTGSNNGADTPPTASSINWSEVAHEYYTDMVSPETCDMPFKFKVRQDGSYTAGPCTTGGADTKVGQITNSEFDELNELASDAAKSSLSQNKCSQGEAFVGSLTDLTVEGVKRRVYRHFPDQLCYRGDKQASESLNAMANVLAEKYYPIKQ